MAKTQSTEAAVKTPPTKAPPKAAAAAAKKPEPTILTLQIDDVTSILQTANVVAKRGSKVILRQIKFSNTEQLVGALKGVLADLSGEAATASSTKKTKTVAPAKPADPKQAIKQAAAPALVSKINVADSPVATNQTTLF